MSSVKPVKPSTSLTSSPRGRPGSPSLSPRRLVHALGRLTALHAAAAGRHAQQRGQLERARAAAKQQAEAAEAALAAKDEKTVAVIAVAVAKGKAEGLAEGLAECDRLVDAANTASEAAARETAGRYRRASVASDNLWTKKLLVATEESKKLQADALAAAAATAAAAAVTVASEVAALKASLAASEKALATVRRGWHLCVLPVHWGVGMGRLLKPTLFAT